MAEQYVYAVTRMHMHEQGLLNAQDIEALVAAPDAAGVFRLLADKGWGSPELPAQDAAALFAYETARTWKLLGEVLDELTVFDVFRIAADYHNLKAAVKLAYPGDEEDEPERYFLAHGSVSPHVIMAAAKSHDFSALPLAMAEAGRGAYEALARTGTGQSCDIVIDRAALVAIDGAGKASGSELLRSYAELTVDSANIKSAVRCCFMHKDRDFILRVLANAGSLNVHSLANAAAQGVDALYACLRGTAYSGAVAQLEVSLAAFERWCDNRLIGLIRPQRQNYFTVEPLAAFVLGRENEIKTVRLILSAKINNLSGEALRERLRDTYV